MESKQSDLVSIMSNRFSLIRLKFVSIVDRKDESKQLVEHMIYI